MLNVQGLRSMSDAPEYVTLNGLATELGLSYKSAQKHRDSGLWKPVTHGANKGKFPLAKCRELYETMRDPAAVAKGDLARVAAGHEPRVEPSVGTGSAFQKARLHEAVYRAKKTELRFQKDQGKVIDREEARRACRAVISVVNERIEGAAAQIAVRVAGIASVAECERIAKDVLRQVRGEIAGLGEALGKAGVDA